MHARDGHQHHGAVRRRYHRCMIEKVDANSARETSPHVGHGPLSCTGSRLTIQRVTMPVPIRWPGAERRVLVGPRPGADLSDSWESASRRVSRECGATGTACAVRLLRITPVV
jgi:hypothetical protein